jgi:Ca-activated chloride channel family protein
MSRSIVSGILSTLILSLTAVSVCVLCQQQPGKAGSTQSQEQGEVVLTSNLVLMNITVTGAQGGFVKNLTKDYFTIKEEGKPQKIEFFGAEQTPFAATILLDISGSMENKISLARAGMAQFADHLRGDDVLAIYQFSDEVKQLQDFTNSRDISDYVWDVRADGFTCMYDCLYEAAEGFSKRSELRRAILVISDGMDNRSKHTLDEAMKKTLAANIAIYSIDLIGSGDAGKPSIEEMQGHSIMKQMAEKTGGRYLASPGGRLLTESLKKIVEELTNQYTVGYYPSNEKRDGKWRKVEVALPKPDVSVHTRAGYYAAKDK